MIKVLFLFFFFSLISQANQVPDWSAEVVLEEGLPRTDIYGHGSDLKRVQKEGYVHALKWPVDVTGLLVPYEPLKYFLEGKKENALHRLIERIGKKQLGYENLDDMYEWLGLNEYPTERTDDVFYIPYPERTFPDYRMGASIIQTKHGKGLTFACATCHSGTFMGKSVMGLTNKRPRANDFFVLAKKYVPYIPSGVFKAGTNATNQEKRMFRRTKENLKYVGAVAPQVLGLDTSLPHVALSLDKRRDDDIASKVLTIRPERHPLYDMPADSKPMPWWNLKYKTRWLSDGSIVQGNPVLTNFLWNELGRGTDLVELEKWMRDNTDRIDQLTAAVFATKAPHWTDFFPDHTIDIKKAKRGEKVFVNSCQKCHGSYIKNWSIEGNEVLTYADRLKTFEVRYHKKTPVIDMGTDPNRYLATKYFASKLNKLKISKWMNTVVVAQKGYVPPPLEGIFLRYPYMHNNSIPNLCALMMRPEDRPVIFIQGPSNTLSDFDQDCLGYPVGGNIPLSWWKDKTAVYRANMPGLSNKGHSKAFWDKDGESLMSDKEKKDLLEFLKTL